MAVLNREYDSLVNVIQTDSIIMPSIDEITLKSATALIR